MADPPVRSGDKFAGRKPARVVNIPPEHRREATRSEVERLKARWKEEFGCDVWVHGTPGPIKSIDIYGPASGADQTQKEINEWIRQTSSKSKMSNAWAKISAYDDWKWSDARLRERQAIRKQVFKGEPPEHLPHITVVEWPEDLSGNQPQILPKDVFGLKLEALDGIRLDEEVYITYSTSKAWAVIISGHTEAGVEIAAVRYRQLIEKICNQTFNVLVHLNLLLDESEGSEVVLQEAPGWWPHRHHRIVPRLIHDSLLGVAGEYRDGAPLRDTQLVIFQESVKLFLESIRFEKDYYDFGIRYGSFVLHSSKRMKPEEEIGKTYPKNLFFTDITRGNECETKRWLFTNDEGTKLLNGMMTADNFDLSRPTGFFGSTIKSSSVQDFRPLLRATYFFQERDATTVVKIEWTDDDEGGYEKMVPRYFKLKPGSAGPKQNMDVKLIELADSRAWQFMLSSMTPISKRMVSPALSTFVANLKVKPNHHPASSNMPIEHGPISVSLRLSDARIEKIYTFNIENSGYKADLAGTWYYQKGSCSWGINFYHQDWNMHLKDLERLQSGESAAWIDPIATFFPDDGFTAPSQRLFDKSVSMDGRPSKGIRLLVEKMMDISRFVNDTMSG